MPLSNTQLKQILTSENYVSPADMASAEELASTGHMSLAEALLTKDFITDDLLGQALAEWNGATYADLNSHPPLKERILGIPSEIALKYRCIFFEGNEEKIVITTDNPREPKLLSVLQDLFPDKKIAIAYSLSKDIDTQLSAYHQSLETRFSEIIAEEKRVAPEIVDQILADANQLHASDIHFEPQKKEVVIRFRIDGVLQEAGRFPREYYENILNRIKVQGHVRIDEHFATQDGSMRYEKDDLIVDIRISIVPTVEGEKIVLRLLAAYVGGFTLNGLGLSSSYQEALEQSARKPFGMILVSGPTGSGKTTTLHSLLRLLNKPEVNITTIEDPVEYRVLGVNQIQVNPATNVTFSHGLRSIVRQDPDIILVGEIRDQETAEIATNAALTGHLLLSTFHANDASSVIPRLLDMHIEPFILSSTLDIIVAQRLVRRVCESCRYSVGSDTLSKRIKPEIYKRFFGKKEVEEYRGKGCTVCGNTGYKGQVALFEIIRMTPEMQELVLKIPSAGEIERLARSQGAQSLFEDGIEKVKNGVTTYEELIRVAPMPQPGSFKS